MIILKNVFKDFKITQTFGWTEFALEMKERYEKTGKQLYKYGIHTGIDFGIKKKLLKSPIHGVVVLDDDANDSGRGIALSIWDKKQNIAVRFYHLKENFLYLGEEVFPLQDIGISGKTAGKLTIGNEYHLHFELVRVDKNGYAIGEYNGAIDPLNEDVIWENDF